MNGTLYVASNTFEEADGLGLQHGGRLATCEAEGRPVCLFVHTLTPRVVAASFGWCRGRQHGAQLDDPRAHGLR